MALYVFITEQCKRDASVHSYEDKIERFAERIRKEQNTTLFDPFPPSYLKKRFERQIRLIAAERFIGEHVMVCFYRLIVRGSKEYEDFVNDPKGYGKKNFDSLVSDDELKSWLDKQMQASPPLQKTQITDEERNYLWGGVANFGRAADEVYICESPEWVEHLQSKTVQNRLSQALNVIFDMVGNDNQNVEIPVDNELSILGRYFPSIKKLYLIAAITQEIKSQVDTIKKKYRRFLQDDNQEISEDEILRNSSRAYRWELLCDLDLWLEAERDEVANLALSPEEAAILESVSHSSTSDSLAGFPLFINGRAGSGKSTILQYLFADYLYYHLLEGSNEKKGPLYLTCSAELLERSRTVLLQLLRCGHRFAQKKNNHGNKEIKVSENNIKDHFQEFHRFLYDKLTQEERRDKFHPQKYINYPIFRTLWEDKFSKDKSAMRYYSSDISWHVLRTYIKGLSIDDYLDSEEYDELPKGEKSVTKETFEKIYSRVWTNWYKPLITERDYWDDQDLVRYLLKNERIEAEYPVIFADEAQDFTRIELEVLFRLSVFSNRQLSPQELGRVPFAFAGDPFQTLNPTGFRWEAIKSGFVEKFVHSLDPSRQSQVKDLNYHELSFNYRSTRNIVNLCNTIQLLRSKLFGIPSITPQTTWKLGEKSPMPCWFERGDPSARENLNKEKDITIIVPCELGEESEFVQNNVYLAPLVKRDEAGVPQNVISPARAKGLEFNRVLLYEFGEYFNKQFPETSLSKLIKENYTFDNPDVALPYEYFLNRLYVAASRPKRRLFVMDSEKGIKNLWSFAIDQTIQDNLLSNIEHKRDVWRENTGLLHQGVPESWSEDREDISVVAERYEREGRSQRSAYMLRSAAMAYASCNNTVKEKACKAEALLIERKFEEAGNMFIEIEDYENALNAFWTGMKYKEIQKLSIQKLGLRDRLEVRFAEYFCGTQSIEEGAKLLRELAERFADKQFKNVALSNDSWNSASKRLVENLINRIPEGNDSNKEIWAEINHAVDRLEDFAFNKSLRATILYQLGDYIKAIELWEKADETKDTRYQKARRHILVEKWENGSLEATLEEGKEIIEHYKEFKQYDKARYLMSNFGLLKELKELFPVQVDQDAEEADLVETIKKILETIVRNSLWDELKEYIQKGSLRGMPKKSEIYSNLIVKNKHLFDSAIVTELAQSQSLVNASSRDVKSQVSDFLKKYLITDGLGWVDYIHPEIAGAALERSGRDIDCLQFYEIVQSERALFSDKQRERAAVRWIKCKLRQAAREQQMGMPIADKHRQEAVNKKHELNIEEDNPLFNAEFPSVGEYLNRKVIITKVGGDKKPELKEGLIETKKDLVESKRIKLNVEDFEFEYSQVEGKLNIKKGMDTALVRIDKKKCVSVDVQFEEEKSVFSCNTWQLVCDLSRIENENILTINLEKLGVLITLQGNREEKQDDSESKKERKKTARKKAVLSK